MLRKLVIAFTSLFLLPLLLLAQDGKLRGKVTDKESGDALIGANVLIEGTTLGASTDVNGEYIILGVPPGVYAIRCSYIGYAALTISNIRVSSNMTTSEDFELSSIAIQVQAVEVVAERPLIQRNTTNTVRVQTQEDIKALPIRGVQTLVALNAGVVRQGGTLYVRGGRDGEVAYFVDGANITNPLFNSENVGLIQEALEEIQLQTGGYTAEFGGANAGIVRSTTRTGGSKFNVTVDYRTDDFAKPGDTFLGTTALGYRNAVLTIGGPAISGIRFFAAGQHNYVRNNQAIFLEPFRFEGFKDDGLLDRTRTDSLLPGPIEFKRNYLYNNWAMSNSFNGNVLFDLQQLMNVPLRVRLVSSYGFSKNPSGGGWPGALGNYYRSGKRDMMNETQTYFGNLRVTHIINPTTFYEVGLSYQSRRYVGFDPEFGDDWISYPDSAANAQRGFYTGDWRNRYQAPESWSTIFKFVFSHEGQPNNSYSKNQQDGIGFTADITSQVSSNWELKAGGSMDAWTMRVFSVGNIRNLLIFLDKNRDGVFDEPFDSEYEKRVRYLSQGGISTYGYTYLGESTDGYTLAGSNATLDAPYKPLYAAAYLQNKFEYNDLILNAGVRMEFYDPKIKKVEPTLNPASGQYDYNDVAYNSDLGIIDETKIIETDPFTLILPRLSFSFPVTDRTVFYAQYGKYAMMPSLSQLYSSNWGFSQALSPIDRSPYGGYLGFEVRPERTTLFETGIRQILTDNLAFTLTGFYKDTKEQIQIRRHFSSVGTPIFTTYQNSDFGTVKGVEITLDLRRTNRLSARLHYTLSDARGTGWDSRSGRVATSDETRARHPDFINPMPFNQTHVGTLVLDYRFAKGDGGPVLEGMGLNLLVTFNSGHNYTKVAEPLNLGQATAWNIGVRSLIDARFRNPEEAVGGSVTPWVFNVDLNWSKLFSFADFNIELYVHALNVLNTKQIINVYPNTGTAQDDGWLKSPFAAPYREIENYEAFYRAINLANRWGVMQTFVGDVYGSPRQIRVGLRMEY